MPSKALCSILEIMHSDIHNHKLRIGIDIGGTFTDFVVFNPDSADIQSFKLPSTPQDPSEAVLTGLAKLGIIKNDFLPEPAPDSSIPIRSIAIIHGSTVATNALLERRGTKTALITTEGFRDVLQIGRQNRPELYDFAARPPEPLVPRDLRFELKERVDPNGDILVKLDETQVDDLVSEIINRKEGPITSVAVVFLFSFANPLHEKYVTQALRKAGLFVSASHEILPEYREYERTSTTVVNAYVTPVLDRYLAKLDAALSASLSAPQISSKNTESSPPDESNPLDGSSTSFTLQIMQSNGGCISLSEARRSGVRCVLSGPAGGVVGSKYIAQLASLPVQAKKSMPSALHIMTFDMGGTSTDVSLIDGEPIITSEAEVGGVPIRVPLLDIHTIGAGGGSIAYPDAGNVLRVGPKSAGADPGPACYGKSAARMKTSTAGDLPPTVTDANLLLGRIPPDNFLGGQMELFPELAEKAISDLGRKLHLDPYQTALGIIEIANAHMERALRVISVERGYDPHDFTLLSFGGAGGLHAADLARRLNIPQVLVPPYASVLSAFGMLAADVIKDYSQTVMLPGDSPTVKISGHLKPLVERGRQEIQAEGFSAQEIYIEEYIEMRYQGQSYELTIPFDLDFVERFHHVHHNTYGYHRPCAQLEIVNLRVRATGRVPDPRLSVQEPSGSDPAQALIDFREVILPKGVQTTPFYRGEALHPGNILQGPAIVVRSDTTIMIGAEDQAIVDPLSNLVISVASNS